MEKPTFDEAFKKFKSWWLKNQSSYLQNNTAKDFQILGVYRDKHWPLKMMSGSEEKVSVEGIQNMYENSFLIIEKRTGKRERYGIDSNYGELTNVGAIVKKMNELVR
jgi:hypothetical protein